MTISLIPCIQALAARAHLAGTVSVMVFYIISDKLISLK